MLPTRTLLAVLGFVLLVVALGMPQLACARPTPHPICQADTHFCVGGALFDHVNPDDVIDVSYGEAPVFKAKFGPLLAIFKLYHTGVLFQNRNTGLNYTVEFCAVFGVPNATIPWIVDDEIVWCDEGAICTKPFIDYDYWRVGGQITPMTTISGAQFNRFIDWLKPANETLTTYELWNIFEHWDGLKSPAHFRAQTCAESVWIFLGALRNMGAVIDMERIKPKHSFINLYSSKPQLVDTLDPENQAKIHAFYEGLQWAGKSDAEKIELFIKFLSSDKYVLHDNKYYLLSPMNFPYFGTHYATEPLPDTPIDL